MGCDIHLQVERREADGWHRVPHPDRECDRCHGTGAYGTDIPNEKMHGEPCYWCKGTGRTVEAFYSDRSYNVFAMLANVRNGIGFAGVDTGDGFVPLTDGRGLPTDLSPEIRAYLALGGYELRERDGGGCELEHVGSYDDEDESNPEHRAKVESILGPGWNEERGYWEHPQTFWLGDHSFTYMSVAELMMYDWERATKLRGWVEPWQFELFRREGAPTSWSGGISGAAVEHISNAQMARMIDNGGIVFLGEEDDAQHPFVDRPYRTRFQDTMGALGEMPAGSVGASLQQSPTLYVTLVEWEVSYSESAKHFLEILNRDIVPLGDPEDVRLVMGFDS